MNRLIVWGGWHMSSLWKENTFSCSRWAAQLRQSFSLPSRRGSIVEVAKEIMISQQIKKKPGKFMCDSTYSRITSLNLLHLILIQRCTVEPQGKINISVSVTQRLSVLSCSRSRGLSLWLETLIVKQWKHCDELLGSSLLRPNAFWDL